MNIYLKNFTRLIVAVGLLQGITSCSQGKRPFLIVQTCLDSQDGVRLFTETMRSIAKSEGMTFIDNSGRTREELEIIGQAKYQDRSSKPTINIAIEGRNGIGVTAGNLGLPPYQIALGFSEGSNLPEAQKFSARVIQALGSRWHIETVPVGRGALPMKTCGG